MRVLVCGGRTFNNQKLLDDELAEITGLTHVYNFGTIIHGNAKGADSLAANWGYRMGWAVEAYPADWKKHGLSAGFIRNKQMLEMGKPDLVVAFPGGKGTENMVGLAKEAGVETRIICIT